MTPESSHKNKPDYGIDAPNVVRNLIICGSVGFFLWLSVIFNLWPGIIVIRPVASIELIFPMGITGFVVTLGFYSTAIWMVWSSKIGKINEREKLLQNFSWKGNEMVLDIGCGRGLMLIGAAKRLSTGKAIGIDIWQSEDLSGNKMEATLENCRIENVEDRTEIKTADMRQLPFADDTFDIILSCSAIHNLYNANDRKKAISEIARVLKPGGQALIDDIRFHNEYASNFTANGCKDIKRVSSPVEDFLTSLITFGSLRPGTIMAKKEV